MLDWIRRWFGQGQAQFKFQGVNPEGNSVTGTARVPYVGAWNQTQAEQIVRDQLWNKHGVWVTECELIDHVPD